MFVVLMFYHVYHPGSFFNQSNRTIDAVSAPYPSKSRLSTRSDIYDVVPSPSHLQRSSPASSGTPRQSRNAVASTSRQRPRDALQEVTSSDEENEAVQSSLTRSAQARRKSSVQSGRNNTSRQRSSSPVYDRKGKGRESLFAAPSSDLHEQQSRLDTSARVEESRYSDDGDDDDDQGGFQPAGYGDDDGGYAPDQQYDTGYPDEEDPYEPNPQQEQQSDEKRHHDRYARQEYDEAPADGDPEEEEEDEEQEDDSDGDDRRDAYVAQPDEYEDEDSDAISDELPPPLNSTSKHRDRAAANDSGHMEDEDEESTQRTNGKSSKKKKNKQQQRQISEGPRRKYQKRVVEYPDGVRRSRRDRTSPVAFWRNEHVIYQRIDSPSGAAYYEKVGIADRPKPPVRSLVNKNKRSRSVSQGPNKRAKTRSVSVATDNEDDRNNGTNIGNGIDQDWAKWDEETDPDGIVWDYVDGKEMQRRIAFTSTMLDPKATKHGYRFQRVFTDGDFLGAGLLVIPPGEKKPLKPAKDNTYVSASFPLLPAKHWS